MTNQEIVKQFDDHNTRLTNLEKWRWFLTGGLSVSIVQNLPFLKGIATQGMAILPEVGKVLALGR